MITKQDGTQLDVDEEFEVDGVVYTAYDISGGTIIARGKDNKRLRKRFSAEAAGMTAQPKDKTDRIRARMKLREYWED
jgi:hypothetical protein